ncbi:MAG: DUF3394 domain-containing protein, partial [Rhodospirillaceae bacterium]|nr:DUF3394 domain-containing protein [Rhodospirillaceae bacterium]
LLEEPLPGSPFEKLGNQVDFYGDNPVEIKAVMLPAERIWKEVFYLPALLLLGGVVLLQRRRRSSETVTT